MLSEEGKRVKYNKKFENQINELESIAKIDEEIDEIKCMINEKTNELHNYCKTSNFGEKVEGGLSNRQDEIIDLIISLEEQCLERMQKLEETRNLVVSKLNKIPYTYYQILNLRYVKNIKSMRKIACRMNYDNFYIYDILNRALQAYADIKEE